MQWLGEWHKKFYGATNSQICLIMRIHYIAAMGSCGVGAAGSTLVDSYSETNQSSFGSLESNDITGIAQAFTAIAGAITSAKFYVKKTGAPVGNATAKLYDITGSYGTSAIPNTLLATSDNFDVSTLTTSFALVTLTFSAGNQFVMSNATHYCISIEYSGGDGSNSVDVGEDITSPTHSGNASSLLGTWSSLVVDLCFYVYST